MTEAAPGQPTKDQPAHPPLPPVIELLWGRRERGKRGPRPGLSADAIVDAAVRIADAEGLEAISMARVAAELGFTTMSLYRYVDSKDELLQLMFNASALGAERLVIEGDSWRPRLQAWARANHEALLRHPWIVQIPLADPPLGPNTLAWMERGLAAFEGTRVGQQERLSSLLLLEVYVRGHVLLTSTMGEKPESEGYVRAVSELVDPGEFPALTAAVASGSLEDGGDLAGEEFEFGLQTLLDGVATLVRGRGRRHDPK